MTVIGVTPREFFGLQVGSRPDSWCRAMEPMIRDERRALSWDAHLKPGVSIEQARAEMAVLTKFDRRGTSHEQQGSPWFAK